MAGKIVLISPPRKFDFTNISSGTSVDLVLKNGIDVSGFRSASVIVRTHVNSVASGAGSITLFAQRESRSPEDPGILFTSSADQLGLITIDFLSTACEAEFLGDAFGPMVRVIARGNSNGTGPIAATLSVDLCLKTS